MKTFRIHIVGLGKTTNQFAFELGNSFFELHPDGLVREGTLRAEVAVDKHETFIDVSFQIQGTVRLACDRSLKSFDHPLRIDRKMVFKYGEEDVELSDEIVVIRRDSDTLELGQYLYEFIVLALPMKRLHPDFRDEVEDGREGTMIYTSGGDTPETDIVDPRWEQLKKLK